MLYELPPTNITNGTQPLVDLLAYESSQICTLMPGILFLIFIIVLGSGYLSEDRKRGRGNFPKWFAISGFITATLSLILFLMNGIVNLIVVMITIAVSMVGTLWLLFSSMD